MAQTVAMMIYLFFNLLSHSFLPCMSSGFSLKLIHRDSPHSPLYQPNLSDFERFKKNTKISEARASYFQQWSEAMGKGNSNKLQNVSLRLPLKYHDPIFTVELGLGTPVVKRTLIFDTGSGLTWTQCKPCIRCFKQDQPLFDTRKSRSFKIMSRKNRLAKSFKCTPIGCVYYIGYYSGQISAGVVSVENFAFQTTAGVHRVPGLVFGCGTTNLGNFPPKISGIFGLDKEPISFARQLGSLIKERFSYCLQAINSNTKESYLRFGDEAMIRRTNAQSTPFLKTKQNAILYGLNLSDISIGGQKLGLKQGTFPEGCVIDSGSSVSLLNRIAFLAAKKFFTTYFSKFKNIRRYVGREVPKGFLCYTQPNGFTNFPNMTYHFQGADFHVPSANLFFFERKFFCLAMVTSPNVTILGAYQQRNVRIVYDLKDEMLSFAPEDCAKDAA